MRQTLTKLGATVVIGGVGLAMIVSGVEKTSLLGLSAERANEDPVVPGSMYALLVVGVFLLNVAVFSALTVWSHHLRAHPETRQAPVWVLVTVIVAAGGLGLAGYAAHQGYIRSLDVVPAGVSPGFVAEQVLAATLVIAALVVVGVRWTPRHRPARTRR